MRNTTLRETINSITKQVNAGIQDGIEPLAFAFVLRQMADQCDKLAEDFEKQEKEQEEKAQEDLQAAADNMPKNEETPCAEE